MPLKGLEIQLYSARWPLLKLSDHFSQATSRIEPVLHKTTVHALYYSISLQHNSRWLFSENSKGLETKAKLLLSKLSPFHLHSNSGNRTPAPLFSEVNPPLWAGFPSFHHQGLQWLKSQRIPFPYFVVLSHVQTAAPPCFVPRRYEHFH